MTSNRTQLIARLSILTALTVVLGYYTKLPTPTGIVTLLDLGVYFTAFYFGRKEGAIVGGVGAFLLDLISGYPQWMFFSLLFHGGQGYFAGFKGKARYLGLLLATVVMVGGYALASALLLGNGWGAWHVFCKFPKGRHDHSHGNGWGAAISDIPNNLAQNFVGMALGYVVYYAFQKKGN